MKESVYVVKLVWHYEGESIEGVFKTKRGALNLAKTLSKEDHYADEIEVVKIPLGKRVDYKGRDQVWSSNT